MVFINNKSLEEVASFRLTKGAVYTLFCTLFVLIMAFTVLLLLYTPLRYYVPGYGSSKSRVQVLELRRELDSLGDLVAAQHSQTENMLRIISGNDTSARDTAMLTARQMEEAEMASILPQPDEIMEAAVPGLPANTLRKKPRKEFKALPPPPPSSSPLPAIPEPAAASPAATPLPDAKTP